MNPNRALGLAILIVLFVGPVAGLVFRIPFGYTMSFMAGAVAIWYGIAKLRWERKQDERRRRAVEAYIDRQLLEQEEERKHGAE
ncbi:MAG: hypothetical protein JSS75_10595 [Bacteroidetes bacterium]|nr:hypothetical protein [Bacteroidota bacterium]